MTCSATAASKFSTFLEEPLVSRVNRRIGHAWKLPTALGHERGDRGGGEASHGRDRDGKSGSALRAYPNNLAAATGRVTSECKERGGIDAGDRHAIDERRRNPTRDDPSLRVAAGPGCLVRYGSSTMLSFASTASPRLASTPVAHATRLAGLFG